jgi:hypothetical protein
MSQSGGDLRRRSLDNNRFDPQPSSSGTRDHMRAHHQGADNDTTREHIPSDDRQPEASSSRNQEQPPTYLNIPSRPGWFKRQLNKQIDITNEHISDTKRLRQGSEMS